MNSVRNTGQCCGQRRAWGVAGILALVLAACQGASVTHRSRTGTEGEGVQVNDQHAVTRAPLTTRGESAAPDWGQSEPESEWPPAPFDAQDKAPGGERFWDRIDFGGSVEVEGIWGKNLPYRSDHYGRTTLQLDASYPKDSPRMGVVIQSRRYWDP